LCRHKAIEGPQGGARPVQKSGVPQVRKIEKMKTDSEFYLQIKPPKKDELVWRGQRTLFEEPRDFYTDRN